MYWVNCQAFFLHRWMISDRLMLEAWISDSNVRFCIKSQERKIPVIRAFIVDIFQILFNHWWQWIERKSKSRLIPHIKVDPGFELDRNCDCVWFSILYCDPQSAFLAFLSTQMIWRTVTFTKSPTSRTQGPGISGADLTTHTSWQPEPSSFSFCIR